ncbi:MAG: flippase-like domain-containing protein [Flavobacteriales bacterium]|nr:flippase-like domain-containing protein [Flavobacteriales bacterium]
MENGKRISPKYFLFPLLSIGLLYWAFTKIKLDDLLQALQNANYFWVGLSFFVGVFSHYLRALRWKLLIDPMGYNVRVRTGFYSVMTSYLVNIVTPRVGEVARCAMYNKTDGVPVDKLVGTVFTERVFDLIITGLITVTVIFIQLDQIGDLINGIFADDSSTSKLVKLGILAAIGVAGLIGYLVFRRMVKSENQPAWLRKIFDLINGILDGAKSIFQMEKPFLFIGYTLGIWIMYFFMSYLIFFALDSTSHLGIDAALTTLVMATVAVVVPAPGGFGSYHHFVPAGLALFGIALADGLIYATLAHTTQMVMIATVGGLCVYLGGLEKRKSTTA